MEQGPKREIIKLIQSMLTRVQQQAALSIGVLANHTLVQLPAATTALTTASPVSMGTATLTAKGNSGNFRVQFFGSIIALNSLQAIITPSLSLTQNGIATATPTVFGGPIALPGNTSNPSVASVVGYAETAFNKYTTGFAPTVGQTVVATLSLGASTTGGSVAASAIGLSMQEIF